MSTPSNGEQSVNSLDVPAFVRGCRAIQPSQRRTRQGLLDAMNRVLAESNSCRAETWQEAKALYQAGMQASSSSAGMAVLLRSYSNGVFRRVSRSPSSGS